MSRELDTAVAVTRDVFWVGRHDPETALHCNAYLLVDEQDVVLIDPGSIPDFHVVMRKVLDVVDAGEVTWVVASHQDPDVCGNLAVVEEVLRAEIKVVATPNTIRLIRSLGVRSPFYDIEENGRRLVLKSGRELEFIPTPFLHSPGAMITHDVKTRTAFTSDLFGGLSKRWELFAGAGFLEAMTAFHQLYMPSGALLGPCMAGLATRNFERICPQHGSILEGPQVALAIEHLKGLRCGADLEAASDA
ncbi:MAG: MBL fold metallo-hydrolase [Myxococcales bacterium]|nr:MBL fold metallo-hydrolase [Myxococcales bacterium]